MAERRNACGSKMTVAFSVARFTTALFTPSSLFNAFSTRAEQAAQCIPPTVKVSVIICYPSFSGSATTVMVLLIMPIQHE